MSLTVDMGDMKVSSSLKCTPKKKKLVNCMHESFVSLQQHLMPTFSLKVCKNEVK